MLIGKKQKPLYPLLLNSGKRRKGTANRRNYEKQSETRCSSAHGDISFSGSEGRGGGSRLARGRLL